MANQELKEGYPGLESLKKTAGGKGLLCSIMMTRDGRMYHLTSVVNEHGKIESHCHTFSQLVLAKAGGAE